MQSDSLRWKNHLQKSHSKTHGVLIQNETEDLEFLGLEQFSEMVTVLEQQGNFKAIQQVKEAFLGFDNTSSKLLKYLTAAQAISFAEQKNKFNYLHSEEKNENEILGPLSEIYSLKHLSIFAQFDQRNYQNQYQLFKCIQVSFPQLLTLNLILKVTSTKLINDLFSRVNQNLQTIKLCLTSLVQQNRGRFNDSNSLGFSLTQFKNFTCLDYFSLKLKEMNSVTGMEHLERIISTVKTFKWKTLAKKWDSFTSQSQEASFFKLSQFFQKSKSLQKLVIKVTSFHRYEELNQLQLLTSDIQNWPSSLRHLSLNENKIFEYKEPSEKSFFYQQELFLAALKYLLPNLESLELGCRGFGYKFYGNQDNLISTQDCKLGDKEQNNFNKQLKENQEEKKKRLIEEHCQEIIQIGFASRLATALSISQNLKRISIHLGGAFVAKEDEMSDFLSHLCIPGLKYLELDVELWKNAYTILSPEQQLSCFEKFISSLSKNCSKSLIELKINFDGWEIFQDPVKIVDSMGEFSMLRRLIALGPKNRLLSHLKPIRNFENLIQLRANYSDILYFIFKSLKKKLRPEICIEIFNYIPYSARIKYNTNGFNPFLCPQSSVINSLKGDSRFSGVVDTSVTWN